ncbi:helix-turn-helix domain-containing protein [Brevundimonas sp.]|uniref:helix-turn-helix domain-containing protein n=1 Tax=Brevundimonas sp. TaxID=1871086 RepID=UPI0039C87164
MWWERDEHAPTVCQYPAIIRYLGYEPWPEPATLGDRLLIERRRRGLSIAEAARGVPVDEGTWRRWERGDWKVTRRTVGKLATFLGCSPGN